MSEHNIGDLVYYRNIGLGMIIKENPNRQFCRYEVMWINDQEVYTYDETQIRQLKEILNEQSQRW